MPPAIIQCAVNSFSIGIPYHFAILSHMPMPGGPTPPPDHSRSHYPAFLLRSRRNVLAIQRTWTNDLTASASGSGCVSRAARSRHMTLPRCGPTRPPRGSPCPPPPSPHHSLRRTTLHLTSGMVLTEQPQHRLRRTGAGEREVRAARPLPMQHACRRSSSSGTA